jgi:hypothetical protein
MEGMQLNSPDNYRYFVGIDWAVKMHEVSIIDAHRKVLDTIQVEHNAGGIGDLVDRLTKLSGGESSAVAIAIEMPRGALVETLMERGFHVYSLNPKQSDRFRDRHQTRRP